MKLQTLLIPVIGISASTMLQGEILQFDLSPSGSGAATGLSPANEVPPASGTGAATRSSAASLTTPIRIC
jgi:hypothetical protein